MFKVKRPCVGGVNASFSTACDGDDDDCLTVAKDQADDLQGGCAIDYGFVCDAGNIIGGFLKNSFV